MDFEHSQDQELLRETVARFLATQAPIRPYVRTMLDDPRGTTDRLWNGLGELGVIGLLVPEEHGGAGMGMVDAGVVIEELGRALHPGPYCSSAIGAVSAVVLSGEAGSCGELLSELASGQTIGTVALLEAGRRFEWRSPATSAVPDAESWRINGAKVEVPDVIGADVVIVSATDPGGVIGLFLVRCNADGVTTTSVEMINGTHKVGNIEFDQAPAVRIGDDGSEVIPQIIDRLTVASVMDALGAAQEALRLTVEYANTREQFGKPIGSFQAVAHLCADMLRDVEVGRATAYYACWALDAADTDERRRAVSMAKAHASSTFPRVGASAIQVFGGVGFTWDHDIHLFYKRLLTMQQTYGGESEHLEALADLILG